MRFGSLRLLLAFAALQSAALWAGVTCQTTAAAWPLLDGGLSEPLPPVSFACSGGPANTPINALLFVVAEAPFANVIDAQGMLTGVQISSSQGGVLTPLTYSRFQVTQPGAFTITGLLASFDAMGNLTIDVRGLRATAMPSFRVKVDLAITSPAIAVNTLSSYFQIGFGTKDYLYTAPVAVLQPISSGVVGKNLTAALAAMTPNVVVRLTEADQGAFRVKTASDDAGTRYRVRFPDLPAGSRVFAQDAVAGSNATIPSGSGLLRALQGAGAYTPTAPASSTLLMVRVRDGAHDGTGGTLAWTASPGVNNLGALALTEAAYTAAGEPYFIYEVADASAGASESIELPFYVFSGPTSSNGQFATRATVELVPLAAESTQAAAALPRYNGPLTTGPDCVALGDCTLPYFPQLAMRAYSSTTFTMVPRQHSTDGSLTVSNLAGGVATWMATVEYMRDQPASWIQFDSTDGFVAGIGNYWYHIVPGNIKPGQYRANIVLTQTNRADGSTYRVTQPIQLNVLPAPRAAQ